METYQLNIENNIKIITHEYIKQSFCVGTTVKTNDGFSKIIKKILGYYVNTGKIYFKLDDNSIGYMKISSAKN